MNIEYILYQYFFIKILDYLLLESLILIKEDTHLVLIDNQ